MVSGKARAVGTVQALREQMNLPLTLRLSVRPGAGAAVRDALRTQPLAGLEADGDVLVLSCPREAKMAVLDTVAALRGDVLDLHVREPSLEDVFFGFAD
jgi:Cu-processing system ATP-binding protein